MVKRSLVEAKWEKCPTKRLVSAAMLGPRPVGVGGADTLILGDHSIDFASMALAAEVFNARSTTLSSDS